MNQEGADRGGDCPQRQVERRQLDSEARHRTLDEENGADGNEDVLAEEEPDVVGRRRQSLHLLASVLVELAMLLFRGGFGHWSDQWPDGLWMAGD